MQRPFRPLSNVDGYPVDPKSDKDVPTVFPWNDIPSAFIRAGLKEVIRRFSTRPVMRIKLT